MIKIALDMMGGDNAPSSNIGGVIEFLSESDNSAKVYLVGKSDKISKELELYPKIKSKNFEIVNASDIVLSDDRPSRILKEKPNSSMVKSINLLNDNIVDAVVSAGNTGCLLASSFFKLGTIKNVKRPALIAFIPSENGNFLICDVGANSSAKPIHLLQFSKMASVYINNHFNVPNPKIGLLNIGLEKNKGNELVKESYNLMQEYVEGFIGNIESRYIFDGKADIVVCDGFTGNIVLKLIEGMTNYNFNLISSKLDLNKNKTIKSIKKIYNYEEYGATPILGVKGLVLKSHGSASKTSIKNALKTAEKLHRFNLINKFEEISL
ncbi:MAG: phosphate--acyl-ACP acyltransferase [Gammaproteobacteria bacterium]|nr:phosphate--acyl-ACP acyltransferase [Gammaproteobacteria bacterium]